MGSGGGGAVGFGGGRGRCAGRSRRGRVLRATRRRGRGRGAGAAAGAGAASGEDFHGGFEPPHAEGGADAIAGVGGWRGGDVADVHFGDEEEAEFAVAVEDGDGGGDGRLAEGAFGRGVENAEGGAAAAWRWTVTKPSGGAIMPRTLERPRSVAWPVPLPFCLVGSQASPIWASTSGRMPVPVSSTCRTSAGPGGRRGGRRGWRARRGRRGRGFPRGG